MSVNMQFQAKAQTCKNRNISETINPTKTKFTDQTETNLHYVGGLILPRLNPIWLHAAILKMDMTS